MQIPTLLIRYTLSIENVAGICDSNLLKRLTQLKIIVLLKVLLFMTANGSNTSGIKKTGRFSGKHIMS